MAADVKSELSTCVICQKVKSEGRNYTAPLMPIWANRPFERVHIDLAGPMANSRGFVYILVMVDAFTRWIEAVPLRNKEAKTVANAVMTTWICRYGWMQQLHSDCGTEFENQVMRDLCAWIGIEKSRTTPYHPQGNGMVERANRAIKVAVTTICEQYGSKWSEALPYALWAIRSAINRTIGYTPYELLFGKTMKMPYDYAVTNEESSQKLYGQYMTELIEQIEDVHEHARNVLQRTHDESERWFNKHTLLRTFVPGEKVLQRVRVRPSTEAPGEKFYCRWEGPYLIDFAWSKSLYQLRYVDDSERKWNVHVNDLKPFREKPKENLNADEDLNGRQSEVNTVLTSVFSTRVIASIVRSEIPCMRTASQIALFEENDSRINQNYSGNTRDMMMFENEKQTEVTERKRYKSRNTKQQNKTASNNDASMPKDLGGFAKGVPRRNSEESDDEEVDLVIDEEAQLDDQPSTSRGTSSARALPPLTAECGLTLAAKVKKANLHIQLARKLVPATTDEDFVRPGPYLDALVEERMSAAREVAAATIDLGVPVFRMGQRPACFQFSQLLGRIETRMTNQNVMRAYVRTRSGKMTPTYFMADALKNHLPPFVIEEPANNVDKWWRLTFGTYESLCLTTSQYSTSLPLTKADKRKGNQLRVAGDEDFKNWKIFTSTEILTQPSFRKLPVWR